MTFSSTWRRVTTRAVLAIAALCPIAAAAEPATPGPGATPRRLPNIVFLLGDDLGYGDVGAFGQKTIRTPNIDRLATEGTKLKTHYAGNTVCAPSRCTLLSGLHPGHAIQRDNRKAEDYAPGGDLEGQLPVPANYLGLPLTLKRLGYTTGGFGKWSQGAAASTGNPLKQGFDHFFGYQCQTVAHNYYPSALWDDGKQVPLDNPPFVEGQANEGFVGKEYSADLIAARALQFVRDNKDRPFFLYFPTTLPHNLLQLPEADLKVYDGQFEEKPIPARGANGARAPRAAFAGMVTKMDAHFGQVIDLIRELKLDEDTIIVFTSDNGATSTEANHFFNSGGPFRGAKNSIYEGGVREPAVVRWTGRIAAGAATDRVTGFEDWLPTLLGLIGREAETPPGLDGINFAPTLLGKTQPERALLYRESPSNGGEQSVRVGNWKLLRRQISGEQPRRARSADGEGGGGYAPGVPDPETRAAPGAFELYDLASDVGEQRDVAADHPDIVARLSLILVSQHVPNPNAAIPALDRRLTVAEKPAE